MPTLTFSREQIDRFAAATGDFSPLHVSDAYARRTPYGQRVVHGVLAALEVLRQGPERKGAELESLQLDFARPLFVDQRYELELTTTESKGLSAKLRDGSRLALKLQARFRPNAAPDERQAAPTFPRSEAASTSPEVGATSAFA
jgi:acyl dehydratase